MNLLLGQFMKNIKISFEEEKANITFQDYYFNGIPSPNNIEIKNISSSSFEMTWKIDKIDIIGVDMNKILYKI